MTLAEMIKTAQNYTGTSYSEQEQLDALNSQVGELQGYDCKLCKNKGHVYLSRETVKPCECREVRNYFKQMEKDGLRDLLEKYTFEKFAEYDERSALIKRKAQAFANNSECGKWFYIGGQSGCGKTHICTAITTTLAKESQRGKKVRYLKWVTFTQKANSLALSAEYEEFLKQYTDADILYIDDLFKVQNGKEKQAPSAAEVRRFYELINEHYNKTNSIVIISSEFHLNEISELDEAGSGRIRERVDKYLLNILRCDEANYRLKKNNSL